MAQKRKPGISVLIAAQNEEALVGLCIRSLLDFGDELIIVDNGSTDHTIDIISDLASRYSDKINFFVQPELPDLYHNRQFALERSSYQWIMRADSDFVAYTSGDYNIQNLREFLLSRKRTLKPEAVRVIMSNVIADFWHTGPSPQRPPKKNKSCSALQAIIRPTIRFYRYFPSFHFVRRGPREYTRFWRLMKRITWDKPLWMHCNIKSDMNFLFRSERTNWRQLADFQTFPNLTSYVENIVAQKYGTKNLERAARLYMERHVYPLLQPYDPQKYYPYPSLILEQMKKNPIYKIYKEKGRLKRKFLGIDLPADKNIEQEK